MSVLMMTDVAIPRADIVRAAAAYAVDTHGYPPAGEDWDAKVARHRALLRKRVYPQAAEDWPPTGQAAGWYADVCRYVPLSGMRVARQLARLCGDDSRVTVSWRSLADAVGVRNKAGNLRSYTERGVQVLVKTGWLTVETVGSGRGAKTTFYLMPGELVDQTGELDEPAWVDEDVIASGRAA